jgi:hypothetical protein
MERLACFSEPIGNAAPLDLLEEASNLFPLILGEVELAKHPPGMARSFAVESAPELSLRDRREGDAERERDSVSLNPGAIRHVRSPSFRE